MEIADVDYHQRREKSDDAGDKMPFFYLLLPRLEIVVEFEWVS